ncbi:MAG: hypothetical protein ACP5J4_06655 [Anaerolineae bacterium]
MSRTNLCCLLLLCMNVLAGCQSQAERQVAEFTALIVEDPSNVTAYISRCAMYARSGAYAEPVEDCTAALELAPNSLHALNNRARAYQQWGKDELAVADWETLLDLIEDSESLHAYYQKHRPEELAFYREQVASSW